MTLPIVIMSVLLLPVMSLNMKVPSSYSKYRNRFSSTLFTNSPGLSSIESTVAAFLCNNCRITANSYILLSVSGGLDSMAMLHILTAINRKHLPLDLEVISFNHKLRAESEEEVSKFNNLPLQQYLSLLVVNDSSSFNLFSNQEW